MTITNGYATLAQFKAVDNMISTDATDDTFIEDLITRVSREIDRETGRWFYARTLTRYYDVPNSRQLDLDIDLLTVTTLTNGDGTVLTTADYYLVDKNTSPYYAIRLKETSGTQWLDNDGEIENAITLVGTFGFVSRSATDDRSIGLIRSTEQLCLIWAIAEYKRRYGVGVEGTAQVTGAGVVITPKALPDSAQMTLSSLRRLT